LIHGCDEFIYYDDLARAAAKPKRTRAKTEKPDKKAEAMDKLVEIVDSLDTDYDQLWGSMVKQTIKRVHPGFSESYYGYKSFSDLLKDAESRGLIRLEFDENRGNFLVSAAG
jgi:hypothetical protein